MVLRSTGVDLAPGGYRHEVSRDPQTSVCYWARRTAKLIREQKQRVAEAIKTGLINCIYAVPGGAGNVLIANADSTEQLNERITATPLFLYSEYEIRAPTDYNQYMENVAGALDRQGA